MHIVIKHILYQLKNFSCISPNWSVLRDKNLSIYDRNDRPKLDRKDHFQCIFNGSKIFLAKESIFMKHKCNYSGLVDVPEKSCQVISLFLSS